MFTSFKISKLFREKIKPISTYIYKIVSSVNVQENFSLVETKPITELCDVDVQCDKASERRRAVALNALEARFPDLKTQNLETKNETK